MTTMLDCINEQPRVCEQILADEATSFSEFDRLIEDRQVNRVLVLATGSSLNAVHAAERHLEVVGGIVTKVVEPFTYSEYESLDNDFDLVIAVSQRGTSSSTIDAVKAARDRVAAPILIVTADTRSPLAALGDCRLDIGCGDEAVRYSTKGVTATVLSLLLLSVRLAEHGRREIPAELARPGVTAAVASMGGVIQHAEQYYDAHREELEAATRISILGFGPNVGTAVEAETKIIETVRVPVQGMELEAYMHGPLFELRPEYTLFLTEVPGTTSAERLRQFADFASGHCDHVHIVTSGASTGATRELALDEQVAEELSPLLLIVPYQVLAYRMSASRGIDLVEPAFPDFRSAMRTKVAG